MTSAYESSASLHNAVTDALRNQQTFSRDQLWWLMRTAWRWGYETRVDEENASWPPPKIFNLGKWFDQSAAGQHADAVARLSRSNDHKGGPVETWGDESDDQQVAA